MKFLTAQVLATLKQPQMRSNVTALLRYVVLLSVVIVAYSVIFHLLMVYEGQDHSLLTGLYWTLTVMSTLGFGDITFHSDLGRSFTVLVLLTGIVMLLIVLPFAFIRYFYAPWLEAQIRFSAPREVEEGLRGHVIICAFDELARDLRERLSPRGIRCVVIEPDPTRALSLMADGVDVVVGDFDAPSTYRGARAEAARMVVANLSDPQNTNITLTSLEHAPNVPVIAIADDKDAVDILQLAGATTVFAVKHALGDHLAARVRADRAHVQIIGRVHDLVIGELPLRDTRFAGQTVRETQLREQTGVGIVGCWERGRLQLAGPDARLTEGSVAVLVGTSAQVAALEESFEGDAGAERPVLVIGGGKVGRAAIRSLTKRGMTVHVIERDASLRAVLETLAHRVVIGDAADIDVVERAGITEVSNVVISTHDDAMNIYIAVYCRKLCSDCRIVSRITHDRNLEAILRAGADFVLGQTSLAVRMLVSVLERRELVIIGEGVDLFVVPVPSALVGHTLADSGIGARTGLSVIAIKEGARVTDMPSADFRLESGTELLMLGSNAQRADFRRAFEAD